jgi:hypothetical protein
MQKIAGNCTASAGTAVPALAVFLTDNRPFGRISLGQKFRFSGRQAQRRGVRDILPRGFMPAEKGKR